MTTQARARATLLVNRLIPINFRLMGACLKIRIGPLRRLAAVRHHNCRLPEWRSNFQALSPCPEVFAASCGGHCSSSVGSVFRDFPSPHPFFAGEGEDAA